MAQAGSSRGVPARGRDRPKPGSVSKEQRAEIEDALKGGRLPAVVATSSLELGIDMGAVDLVVQVESPPSVASGLQRVGRAGHQVGAVSRGVVFPKYRGDLLQTAVVVERMREGAIESMRYPRNPSTCSPSRSWPRSRWIHGRSRICWRWYAAPRHSQRCPGPRTTPSSTCSPAAIRATSSRSCAAPRLDRVEGTLTARPGAQRLAVTSGGTILTGDCSVFLVGEKASRVGELDEEMVYESRVGDVFTLGSTSWRIEDITHDQVLVSPAPGMPGRLPFWHGDAPGRPIELGRALGAFVRRSADSRRIGRAIGCAGRPRRLGDRQPARLPARTARGDRSCAR